MPRIASLISAVVITALFMGLSFTSSGCNPKPAGNAVNQATPSPTHPQANATTPGNQTPPQPQVKKDLAFDPAAPEVKQGEEVSVRVTKGKATNATAPEESKLKVKVNAAGDEIKIHADLVTPPGLVNVTVEGGNKATTLKVTVAAPLPPPPPPVKDLKFNPAAPEVKQGDKVIVKVTEGKATNTTLPDAAKPKMTVSLVGDEIQINADKDAPIGPVDITVEGGNNAVTLKVTVAAAPSSPPPVKDLKFDKDSQEVKPGEEVKFIASADSGNITKAELAKADPKAGLTVTSDAKSVTVKADKQAPSAKDIEVNVIGAGGKTTKLKVTVIGAPAAKELKFEKTSQEVKPGEEVTFKASPDSGKITKAEFAKAAPKAGLTVTSDASSVTVKADKQAPSAKDIEVNVIGVGDKTITLKVTVIAAPAAKELKFEKTSQEVKPGEEVTFKASPDSGKITKAELAKAAPKAGLTVTSDASSVTVKADKQAPSAKDIEVNVIGVGDKTITLKVTVIAAPAAKELKFEKTSQEVKPGEEVTFKASPDSGKITKAELAKADPKAGLTVTSNAKSVTVKADKEAPSAKDIEVNVIGAGDKATTLKVTVAAAPLPLQPPFPSPVKEQLKFDPAAPEVKQGGKVTVKVSEGKATKASAPEASKLTLIINPAGNEIVISADDAAIAGDVEISVEGGATAAKLKVKVLPK